MTAKVLHSAVRKEQVKSKAVTVLRIVTKKPKLSPFAAKFGNSLRSVAVFDADTATGS